jgi:arginyl-tRNA synthetase
MKRNTRKNIPFTYSKEDYNSNDGMLTTIWGPSMWHCLHTISFNYPVYPTDEDKRNYMNFIINLKNILPCGKCRKNLTKNFKKLPLNMSNMKSRETFSKYIYDLHEVINKMLCKKSKFTYEDIRVRYENFRARCINNKTKKQINKNIKEKGCVIPFYGKKSKCVLQIVPDDMKCDTFQIGKDKSLL